MRTDDAAVPYSLFRLRIKYGSTVFWLGLQMLTSSINNIQCILFQILLPLGLYWVIITWYHLCCDVTSFVLWFRSYLCGLIDISDMEQQWMFWNYMYITLHCLGIFLKSSVFTLVIPDWLRVYSCSYICYLLVMLYIFFKSFTIELLSNILIYV